MRLPDVLKNVAAEMSVPERVIGGLAVVGATYGLGKLLGIQAIHTDPESGMPYVRARDGVRLDPVRRVPVDTKTGYFIID